MCLAGTRGEDLLVKLRGFKNEEVVIRPDWIMFVLGFIMMLDLVNYYFIRLFVRKKL